MKLLRLSLLLCLCLAPAACNTIDGKPMTKGEIAARRMNLDGVHLDDRERMALRHYPQARKMPFGLVDREVYEIPNPKPQISMAVMYFVADRLEKIEFRYFNGPGVSTLSTAGGWAGLRDFMIGRFGPPTKVGNTFQVENEFGDLKPQYAKFNGEWNFPRENLMVQYIAFADNVGGMGLVTLLNTAEPAVMVQPLVKAPPSKNGKIPAGTITVFPAVTGTPDPGF
jgi:hypothetical protein